MERSSPTPWFLSSELTITIPGQSATTSAVLRSPASMTIDGKWLFFADTEAHRVYRVDITASSRVVEALVSQNSLLPPVPITGVSPETGLTVTNYSTPTTFGAAGARGVCGPASEALVRTPRGVAVLDGKLFVSDAGNDVIKEVQITPWPGCVREKQNFLVEGKPLYWKKVLGGANIPVFPGYHAASADAPVWTGAKLPAFIDEVSGRICGGEGCFAKSIESIDQCAFACEHIGKEIYPFKPLPAQELTISISAADRIRLGMLTGASGGPEYLRSWI